jgi:hypothetical protein
VLILKIVQVLCFHTLLQVLILKRLGELRLCEAHYFTEIVCQDSYCRVNKFLRAERALRFELTKAWVGKAAGLSGCCPDQAEDSALRLYLQGDGGWGRLERVQGAWELIFCLSESKFDILRLRYRAVSRC